MIHLGRFLAPIAAKIAPKLLFFSLEEIWLVWYGMSDAINDELFSHPRPPPPPFRELASPQEEEEEKEEVEEDDGEELAADENRRKKDCFEASPPSPPSPPSALSPPPSSSSSMLHIDSISGPSASRPSAIRHVSPNGSQIAVLFQSPKDALELSYFASEKTRLKKRVHFWN